MKQNLAEEIRKDIKETTKTLDKITNKKIMY